MRLLVRRERKEEANCGFFVKENTMNRTKSSVVFTALALILTLQSCGLFSPISYYDPTTHRNLIEAKVYTMFLYESFMDDSVDYAEIKNIRFKLALAYEYEKGKGEENKETAELVKKIQDMFKKHVDERLKDGKWNEAYYEDKLENIKDAFDTAISAELLKNQPK